MTDFAGGAVDEINVTFHGVHDWFKHLFEKFGWMLLDEEGKKLEVYIMSINKLLKQIELKKEKTKDNDKLSDLEITEHKVKVLKQYAEKLLQEKQLTKTQSGGYKKSKSKTKSKTKSKKSKSKKSKSKKSRK